MTRQAAFHPKQHWYHLRREEVVRVRIFGPKGHYPRGRLSLPSGFYHADHRMAALVTKGYCWQHYIEGCGFDEFESPFPAEAIFMGSMVLCEKPDEPRNRLYPLHTPVLQLDPDTIDLIDPRSQDDVLRLIRDVDGWPINERSRDYYAASLFSSDLETFDSDCLELDSLSGTWSRIAPSNFVLIRGLVALIKSDMLAAHQEFGAEALMTLYIALECSYRLILEHLTKSGMRNPSASDAARWMHDLFYQHWNVEEPGPTYKYFQEFYEGRVVMFHPRSRFGDLPYAPNFWDDVIHLRAALPGIFYYLVNGRHSPAFLASVDEFRSTDK